MEEKSETPPKPFDVEKLKKMFPPNPQHIHAINEMIISDRVSILFHQLKAIEKWEKIAEDEFEQVKYENSEEDSKGFPEDYDPIKEEAFVLNSTRLAIYGSMSVSISALVEKFLHDILRQGGNIPVNGKKPQFEDFITSLKNHLKCSRSDFAFHDNHLLIRKLANRFRHSGGEATEEFETEYGEIIDAEVAGNIGTTGTNGGAIEKVKANDPIPYHLLPWKKYIEEARSFLMDVSLKLSQYNSTQAP